MAMRNHATDVIRLQVTGHWRREEVSYRDAPASNTPTHKKSHRQDLLAHDVLLLPGLNNLALLHLLEGHAPLLRVAGNHHQLNPDIDISFLNFQMKREMNFIFMLFNCKCLMDQSWSAE